MSSLKEQRAQYLISLGSQQWPSRGGRLDAPRVCAMAHPFIAVQDGALPGWATGHVFDPHTLGVPIPDRVAADPAAEIAVEMRWRDGGSATSGPPHRMKGIANMTAESVLAIFEPILTDARGRLARRAKANPEDVRKIFGPVFQSIARAAHVTDASALERLATWAPADVSEEGVSELVNKMLEPSDADLAERHRKQDALEAELRTIRNPERPPINYY